MMIIKFLLFSVINYLIGSVPWALVIGKAFYKTDVREFGSGNLGATNTGRILGMKPALLVGILDGLKGFLPALIESLIDYRIACAAAVFLAVGHCYPLFAQFKGGKGVATSAGAILALSLGNFTTVAYCAIMPGLVWFAITILSGYVSLGSLFGTLLSAVNSTWAAEDVFTTLAFTLLFAVVTYRHKDNIRRLLDGTETKRNY